MLRGNLRKGQAASHDIVLEVINQVGHKRHCGSFQWLIYYGMECSRTEGFGNHPGMTHRIGRVLVAGGSGCGIIDPFESGTGVDTEAARFLPCNTLVLPPAEHVWTIISCGAMAWQPATEILDRIAVVLFQYIAIFAGRVIIASLKQRMKVKA